MHSEALFSPEKMHASLIREKISEKVGSAKKAAAQEEGVDYVDIIYLIVNKSIHQNVILAFLTQIYRDDLSQINKNWKEKLSQDKMLQDVCQIKKRSVEKQWTEVNINHNHVREKQEKYKKYQKTFKTRGQLNHRIKELSDNLKIIENNINMCQKQTEELKLREQYKQMREQFRFLTNKSRKLKHLSQEKIINSSLTKSQQKLKDIYQRIQEITIQEKRLKQIEHLKFNKKQSTKSSQSSPKRSKDRLNKLEEIFIQFSREEVKQFMLFDQIMKTHKYMSLQNYLRFVNSSGIGSQLTLQERVNIFKNVSQFQSKVSFLDFMQILKEICAKQCEKLNVKFKASILDVFLQQMTVRLQNSSRKTPQDPLLSNSNEFINNLRSQVFSNYHFKVKAHTGKQKKDIQQYLIQKKKANKTEPSINLPARTSKMSNITLAKLTNSGQCLSRNGDRSHTGNSNNDKKFMKRKFTNNYKTVNIHQDQPVSESTSFKGSFEKDTYTNIFLRKRTVLKSQKKEEKSSDEWEESKRYLIDERSQGTSEVKKDLINLTPATYDDAQQRDIFERQQLKDIVELDEDDPFLTNHLSMKYSLKTNKPPSQQSKYHY